MNATLTRTLWNPVLTRELLSGFRSPRLQWILLLYLLIPFAVIVADWPTNAPYYGGSALAVQVWDRFLFTQLWLVVLLTPIFAAYVVSAEFELRTAEFLWTTLVSPPAIVLSKILAVVLLSASLLIASLPALSLIFFLGGVDVGQLVEGYGLLMAIALCATATAVFFSAAFRRGHVSLLCTYGVLFVCFVGGVAAFEKWDSLQVVSALLLGAGLVFALFACWAGSRPIGERARPNVKPVDDPALLKARRERWPYYLIDPLRRLPPLPDTGNVLATQEPRTHPLHRSGWGYRCLYVFIVPAMCLMIESMIDGREPHAYVALWWTNFFIGGVWIALLHAVSMTMDQELQTLESLRLTNVNPSQFLQGKWLGSSRMRWIMTVVGLVTLSVSNLYENRAPGSWFWEPLSWWVEIEVLGLAAFAVSSFCSRTMVAVAWSLTAAVFLACLHLGLEGSSASWLQRMFEQFAALSFEGRSEAYKLLVWAVLGGFFWFAASIGVQRKWKLER